MAKGDSSQTAAITASSPTRLGRLHSQIVTFAKSLQQPPLSLSCVCAMSSSDESVRFVGENNPGTDPSKVTSRMAGSQSVGPSSGRRRSLRKMAAAFRRLIDEEEEREVRGRRLPMERRRGRSQR
ncbi:UNVERIFIED_CONTAM: hypothetical protein Sradi_1434800 [Sesamum radiatum]|uniref:Uncharacterized protein n=1 Tax=Sesamum radiatum TaxID=300843 RepID=A0AAW2U9Q2_SESRA